MFSEGGDKTEGFKPNIPKQTSAEWPLMPARLWCIFRSLPHHVVQRIWVTDHQD